MATSHAGPARRRPAVLPERCCISRSDPDIAFPAPMRLLSVVGLVLVGLVVVGLFLACPPAHAGDEPLSAKFFDPEDGWLDVGRFLDTAAGFLPVGRPIT